MKLTVAICTHNPSTPTIVRVLDAIATQLADMPAAELIVVDNNSLPPISEHDYAVSYPIVLIRELTPGLTAAREAVIENASGDVIVFVDDDNILGEGYLAGIIDAFTSDPDLVLLGGAVIPEYETEPPAWFSDFEEWLAVRRYKPESRIEMTELPRSAPYTRNFPVGAGFAVRRDVAVAHRADCADTTRIEGRRGATLSSGEDLDLAFFALSRGDKVAISGALSLTHVIAPQRVSEAYLQRLAVGNVESSRHLEQKWAPRYGRSVYLMFAMPLGILIAKLLLYSVLALVSPRYKIKRCIYVALVRVRMGRTAVR